MAYMSYCRFEGTASDFGECIEDLKKGKVLNQYEVSVFKQDYYPQQKSIQAL